MTSVPITSWQIDGEKMKTVTDFIFLGSKIIVGGDCSHEIKSYDQPRQHIKKQRRYFANKGPSSQSYGFSVVMYGCVSWPIKKAEHQRIHVFGLLVLEKTLEKYLDCKDIQSVYPKGNKS